MLIITSNTFKILDKEKECFRIILSGLFTGAEAGLLREEVEKSIASEFDTVYIDAKDVIETDLSAINEIIHSHYTLTKAFKKLIFLYKKKSVVEKWVETSGLDLFVATAIVPAE